jgi:hypothetical protein
MWINQLIFLSLSYIFYSLLDVILLSSFFFIFLCSIVNSGLEGYNVKSGKKEILFVLIFFSFGVETVKTIV